MSALASAIHAFPRSCGRRGGLAPLVKLECHRRDPLVDLSLFEVTGFARVNVGPASG